MASQNKGDIGAGVKVFNLGNIVEVFGRTTPALEWKFSGVEQAWMAAGRGVLVKVAGAMDQNGSVYQE